MSGRDAMNLCSVEGCNEVHNAMGQCRMHYSACLDMIRRGEVTKQELIDAGVWRPRLRSRRVNVEFCDSIMDQVRKVRNVAQA